MVEGGGAQCSGRGGGGARVEGGRAQSSARG